MFQLKRRTADMPRSRKKKKQRTDKNAPADDSTPFLVEINPGLIPSKTYSMNRVLVVEFLHTSCTLCFFVDGSEPKKALLQRLTQDLLSIGSDRSAHTGPSFLRVSQNYRQLNYNVYHIPKPTSALQLVGPDIHPQHCVVAHSDGIVTITPARLDAETYVNNRRLGETTLLQHGAVLRFGRHHNFRYIDPMHGEVGAA